MNSLFSLLRPFQVHDYLGKNIFYMRFQTVFLSFLMKKLKINKLETYCNCELNTK